LSLSYTLYWYADDPGRPPGGRVEATRQDGGTDDLPHRLVVDFSGKRLNELPADTVLRGVITIGSGTGEEGELISQQVMKNPVTGGWRLAFRIRPKTKDPIELRAYLAKDGETLTETWTYRLHPGE
jgi:glucans biosynthesis protein